MDARLRTFLVRSGFLFLISLVLVAGFWYHREFYQIGFTNLLIIGPRHVPRHLGGPTRPVRRTAPRSSSGRTDVLRRGRGPPPEGDDAAGRPSVGGDDRAWCGPRCAGPV